MADNRGFVFGPGEVFGELLAFVDGTAPTVVQPFRFDIDQDLTIDFATTPKELWGQSIYPVAVGLGEGKVTGKIRQGRMTTTMMEAMLVGQVNQPSTGIQLTYPQGFKTTIPATPYQVTITPPGSGTFVRDWGVRYTATGGRLTKVSGAVVAGQYSISGAVYTFAAADTLLGIVIDYEYSLTTGNTIAYSNSLQGQIPLSHLRYQGSYGGRYIGVDLPQVVGNKMMITTKQKDWVIPEFDFVAYANSADLVATLYETDL
jgi:hypothetical protein